MPETTYIEKIIPPPTPPPRQVIVERIPAPERPRDIVYEVITSIKNFVQMKINIDSFYKCCFLIILIYSSSRILCFWKTMRFKLKLLCAL